MDNKKLLRYGAFGGAGAVGSLLSIILAFLSIDTIVFFVDDLYWDSDFRVFLIICGGAICLPIGIIAGFVGGFIDKNKHSEIFGIFYGLVSSLVFWIFVFIWGYYAY